MEKIRHILFGNLDAWKQAINDRPNAELKKFIIQELQRFEDEITIHVNLSVEKSQTQTKMMKKLVDQNIRLMAMLDTISDPTPSPSESPNQPKALINISEV